MAIRQRARAGRRIGNEVRFKPLDLEALIDSPLFAGRFDPFYILFGRNSVVNPGPIIK